MLSQQGLQRIFPCGRYPGRPDQVFLFSRNKANARKASFGIGVESTQLQPACQLQGLPRLPGMLP